MAKRQTQQDRNRCRTERARSEVRLKTLWIVGLSPEEREHMQSNVFYSGAGADDIASYAEMLPLAITVLAKLRKREKVTVRVTANGFELSAKKEKQ